MVDRLHKKIVSCEARRRARRISKFSVGAVALLVLSACSGGGAGSGTAASSNDNTIPDPLADLTYATTEEVPLVIRFEPASDTVTYNITGNPQFGQLTIQPGNQQFVYLPQKDFFGYDRIAYSDGASETVLSVLVRNVNDAPILRDDLRRVAEQGSLYQAQLNAIDADGDQLVYSAQNLPEWLRLNTSTGSLFGTPSQQQIGLFEDISFKIVDPSGEFSEISGISIEVLDINDAPTINPDQFPSELNARESVLVNVFPDDPDGDNVSISVEPNDFVDVVAQGGSIEVTAADVTDVSDINLVVIATDALGREAREIIPMTILPLTESGKGKTLRGRKSGVGVHLVVLGDGYRADQQDQFRDDVDVFVKRLEVDEGVAPHFDAWNVHMIESISVDSGIDDDFAFDFRDTAYGAGYFCASIQRLICADSLKVLEAAFEEYPDFHQIILLVNDPRYGGSGGQFSVTSASYPDVALHEMGHSFAGLADEYVDQQVPKLSPREYTEGRYPNITKYSDASRSPWAHWVGQNNTTEVGAFEGAFYQPEGFYRPTRNSRMRNNSAPFGPVNSEQWALRVYEAANAVIEFSPTQTVVSIPSGQSQTFNVEPLFDATVQSVMWSIDGVEQPAAYSDKAFTPALSVGRHTVSVFVDDISGLIRMPGEHAGQFRWTWEVDKL